MIQLKIMWFFIQAFLSNSFFNVSLLNIKASNFLMRNQVPIIFVGIQK